MIRPHSSLELVNDKTPLRLVEYDLQCTWCYARLCGIALAGCVPRFCNDSHKRRYRRKGRTSTIFPPLPTAPHIMNCVRCGIPFHTYSFYARPMCSVMCLLKSTDPDKYGKCWRKRAWPTIHRAIRASWQLAQNTGDHRVKPYECPFCHYWHTGHLDYPVTQPTVWKVDNRPFTP